MASQRAGKFDPKEREAFDAPLIALTQRCNGDLTKVMDSFFSFLHRRTDFYLVPHEDDVKEKTARMGFREGDAEKLLIASFRQYPLRKIPRQVVRSPQSAPSASSASQPVATPAEKSSQVVASDVKKEDKPKRQSPKDSDEPVRYTEEGLQIPVGNGGTGKGYKWTQTLEECSVLIGIPEGLRGKDLSVKIASSSISISSKKPMDGESEPRVFLKGDLEGSIVTDESTWTLEGGVLILVLFKKEKSFWSTILQSDEKIDTSMVDSRRRIGDYDADTQGKIRQIIHQQSQSKNGLPPAATDAMETLDLANNAFPEKLPPGVEYIDSKKLDEQANPTK